MTKMKLGEKLTDETFFQVKISQTTVLIIAMTDSPQQTSYLQNLLGVLPAPVNDAGSMVELPPC